MPIDMLNGLGAGTGIKGAVARVVNAGVAPDAGGGFAESLGKMLEDVQHNASEANTAVAGMVDKSTEVHDAMIALQRAEMSLELTVQVRNKFVQAYQEIMRMSI